MIRAMRVLLVEDEPHAAHVLAKGLREHAYVVRCRDCDGTAWAETDAPRTAGGFKVLRCVGCGHRRPDTKIEAAARARKAT